ncbi:Uncharacterised protein at_DN1317 [Pycnogonum litorale]
MNCRVRVNLQMSRSSGTFQCWREIDLWAPTCQDAYSSVFFAITDGKHGRIITCLCEKPAVLPPGIEPRSSRLCSEDSWKKIELTLIWRKNLSFQFKFSRNKIFRRYSLTVTFFPFP